MSIEKCDFMENNFDQRQTFYCVRQRAGPLVKECRSIRPRLSQEDTRDDRKAKNELIRYAHSAVCRTQADRLELRLEVLIKYLDDLLLISGGICFVLAAWGWGGRPAALAVAGGWLCLLAFLVARGRRGGGR